MGRQQQAPGTGRGRETVERAPTGQPGYNDRLFAGGLRSYLHHGRFLWLQRELRRLDFAPASVFELGCFDGKTIRYLPASFRRYVGCDANWEGGLDLARHTWRGDKRCEFLFCQSPDDLRVLRGQRFDVAVCMETLEHLDDDVAVEYLALMSKITRGYVFITVPNEKGPVFLTKHLAKRLLPWLRCRETESYTLSEVAWLSLGACGQVERNEHKGFDYGAMIALVREHFDVVRVSGIPLGFLPPYVSFGVGLVGRTRAAA
jgi:SAM-dependent methyltransferase